MKHKINGTPWPVSILLLYILSLTVSICCAGATWNYEKQMYLQFQHEEQHFRTVAASYLAVNEDVRFIRENINYVRNLHEHGVLGEELRLDWIEALQKAGERLGLSLHYQIGSQVEYQPAVPVHNGSYRVYYSPMRVKIDLLHEANLHAFFVNLDRSEPGMYSITSCSLSRLRSKIDLEQVQGNIRAECDLAWFNIRKHDGSAVKII